ncbi:MAG: hypothetical protein GF372_09445 [Candidatus Marinimicrobia bacterium]|nr:hypothetical protein [Candidatus Neomarinimicrobiota bacterium]
MDIELKILPKWAALLAALLLLGYLSRSLGILVCAGVAIYALGGPKQSVQALTILAFLIMTQKLDISMGRWLILFAAFGRTLLDSAFARLSTPQVLRPLLLFIGVVLITSFFYSMFPTVSILKIVTFSMGTTTALIGLHRTRHLKEYWFSWIYTFALFIIFASLPMYFLPGGFDRNGVGFQGITSHPQTLGPILAPLVAFLSGLYLFHPSERRNKLVGIAALIGWIEMYTALSRTSMFAALLAFIIIVVLAYTVKTEEWGLKVQRALALPEVVGAGLLVFILLGLQWSNFQEQITQFIYKDDNAGSVTEILRGSRGYLIDRSMMNFHENPVVGIGFGVPSDPGPFGSRIETGPFGLPIGASVEKGFMPSAVLEETGIIGAALIIFILAAFIKQILRHGNIIAFWMFTAGILINLGEMIFFSMGGNGLYLWIIFGFCYTWSTIIHEEQTEVEDSQVAEEEVATV